MTSIKRIAATLALGAGLMLPAAIGGAEAAPVNAAAQTNQAISKAAGAQLELIGKRHRHWRRHRGHRHSHFWWGAPFVAAPFFYGGYYDYPYYSYSYGSRWNNYCYRECREFYGPRYCRRHWRRFC